VFVGRLTKRKKYDNQKKLNNISPKDDATEAETKHIIVLILVDIAKVFPEHFQFQSSPLANKTHTKANKTIKMTKMK